MRISDTEIKKILEHPEPAELAEAIVKIEEARVRQQDQDMVRELTASVTAMPDREAMISELKARIEAGTYAPTAEDIVQGMVRRAIADHVR
ncbi:MAG: flagellar biosynthesis anti-sigma factor FlgM [Fimbriimonas sp.]